MRIAFVNSAWPQSWGGGEKWSVEAAEWFQQRGDEVCVIGRPQSRLIDVARQRGLSIIENRFGGDFDPFAILSARKLLREFAADLVVVNFNKEAWQFGLAAKRLRIPLLARHGFRLFRRSLHHRQLAGSVLTRLVVNARSIKEYYATLEFDVSRVAVIHNGVKSPVSRRGELRKRFGVPEGAPLILAAGRIESQKRFDRVLEIASALVPDYPNIQFLIAGEGPERESLERDARARGLTDHIRFVGFVSDLAQVMGDADLFILTSDEEGTPNVLLEAMAAQVACVSFNVGAVPDILTGALSANGIAPGDVAAMTERIRQLLADRELRGTVASQMRSRMESEFSFEHSMQEFAALFESLVAKKT